MTLVVLQNNAQVSLARAQLENEGASGIDSWLVARLKKLGVVKGVAIRDYFKSWDVATTLQFLGGRVSKDAAILDIGCYASEILVALHKTGYSKLCGVDLNPNLQKMPFADSIRYEQANFMQTPFADGAFEVVTSISVIEHGFNPTALLTEISRLLKAGGYFIASFDYWPEKIDTSEIKFFNMDWKIFSKQDVEEFVAQAAQFGLAPVSEMQYAASEKPVDCGGKKYTFAWMALKKVR